MEKQLNYDSNNILTLGGVNTLQLVKKFGSPLYVIDEDAFRQKCQMYSEILEEIYPNSHISYASKALCCKAMYNIIKDYPNMTCDVVSGGEILTAKATKFDSSKIYFHGNNKLPCEIDLALKNNIFNFIVDSTEELEYLEKKSKLAKFKNKINILIRVNPGIEAHTHEYVQTSRTDSKFGINIDGGEAEKFIVKASQINTINFLGIHYHIGSQIFDKESFKIATKIILDFICLLKSKHNIDIQVINAGGGFGAWYTSKDPLLKKEDYKKIISTIAKEIKNTVTKFNLLEPKFVIEPGRSIIAEAGTTLYTVGSIKEIKGVRKYVSVDGGMFESPRHALYGSQYTAVKCKKEGEKIEKVTIVGKCCESGDCLTKDAKLEKVNTGDIIAILSTGAYHYSMASNYNRNPIPPIVMVKNGKAKVIVKGQTYKDMLKYDI